MFQIHFHLKSELKFNIECCKSTFNQKVKVKFHLWQGKVLDDKMIKCQYFQQKN